MPSRNALIVYVVISVGIVLAVTNPTQQDYVSWLRREVVQQNNGSLGAVAAFFLAEPLVDASTRRQNYFLFSIFTTALDAKTKYRALGLFHRFFVLRSR